MANQEIARFCKYGNNDKVKEFFNGLNINERKRKVNEECPDKLTYLMIAAQNGHFHIVEDLWAAGAEIDRKDENGETAIQKAASKGFYKVVKFLLEKKANITDKDKLGNTILHKVGSKEENGNESMKTLNEILRALKEFPDVLNAKNDGGETAIHKAAERDFPDHIMKFWKAGVDIGIKDGKGETAFHKAVVNKDTKALRRVFRSIIQQNNSIKECLLNAQNKVGETALHKVARKGSLEAMQILKALGIDILLQNSAGETALHVAARQGQLEKAMELLKDKAQARELMFVLDSSEDTFLHSAIKSKQIDFLEKILSHLENSREILNFKKSPVLLLAIQQNNKEVFSKLLSHGADLFPTDDAWKITQILKFLQNNWRDLNLEKRKLFEKKDLFENKHLLKYIVDKDILMITEREEFLNLLIQITKMEFENENPSLDLNKTKYHLEESKHAVYEILKKELDGGPGFVNCINSVNLKFPWTSSKKTLNNIVSIFNNLLLGYLLYILDVALDIYFVVDAFIMYSTDFEQNYKECQDEMNVDFGELQETCQKTDGLVDCKHMFQKTTSFLMDSCDLVKGRFTESTYLIIAIFSLVHILLPFFIALLEFLTSKRPLTLKRFPNPLITKGQRFKLSCDLHNLHMKKDELDYDKKHEDLKKKIEKNSKVVNISIIIEACLESSFQLWFQTLYMFPIFVGLSTNTYTAWNIVRILGIMTSFLTTAYTQVFIRHLDKHGTLSVQNFVLLFFKVLCDVVSKLLIFGCFLYIHFGTFEPITALCSYYGFIVFLMVFNAIFTDVNWCRVDKQSFWDWLFDSLGSFYTYNDFDLKTVSNFHTPSLIKQTLYSLCVFIILLGLTVASAIRYNQGEILQIPDINGEEKPFDNVNWILGGAWVLYGAAIFFNIIFYAIHPSEVEIGRKIIQKEKWDIPILGVDYDVAKLAKKSDQNQNNVQMDESERLVNGHNDSVTTVC